MVAGGAPASARRTSPLREYLPAGVVFILATVLWEAFVSAFDIQFYLLPAPRVIIRTFREQAGVLFTAGWYTFQEALAGYAMGCALGVLSAMAASRAPAFAGLILPYAIASASVPIITLAPLAIVWFGVGQGSKIAVVTLMTFFPTFISTLRGLLATSPQRLELMRSYAASTSQVFFKLRLPSSLPYMLNAFKVGTTLAMIGAVVSEFFGGPANSLGVSLKSKAALFQTTQAWSAIVVACGLGLAFCLVVVLVERLVMPWHAEARQ